VSVIKQPARSSVLTINGGSSSLKFALFEARTHAGDRPARLLTGQIERVGFESARATVAEMPGGAQQVWQVDAPDLGAAADVVISWIEKDVGWRALLGIGHRIVHGGPRYCQHAVITPDLVAELSRISPFDPAHLPGELALIERFSSARPELPQVACFDTAFHHDMPVVARIVPIPRRFGAAGVRRYGFHGLSYTFLLEELDRLAGPEHASGRVILAHLGSGASMAAVHRGRPIDTTMGFTPTSGLVMCTRSGDLDPSLPLFLARVAGVGLEEFQTMVNKNSGLLGVSETSSDLRDLLREEPHDVRAAEAVGLFVYQAKKAMGALAAALGGLDALVFSGGIGENSSEIRARICAGLDFLGLDLQPERNQGGNARISSDRARASVWVIRTDEEFVIARATAELLSATT
jgi:acetate kinase